MKSLTALVFAAVAANILPADNASAQAISSGNDLYAACRSTELYPLAKCIGYVQGVKDGILVDHILGSRNAPFCLRSEVTLEQLRDIVLKFIQDNPALRDQHAAGFVELALVQAFPCTARGSP
jgi:hypothetical protein